MRGEPIHIYVSEYSNDLWIFSKIFVMNKKIGEWVDD